MSHDTRSPKKNRVIVRIAKQKYEIPLEEEMLVTQCDLCDYTGEPICTVWKGKYIQHLEKISLPEFGRGQYTEGKRGLLLLLQVVIQLMEAHRWQPPECCPWDSRQSTQVGCHFPLQCIVKVKCSSGWALHIPHGLCFSQAPPSVGFSGRSAGWVMSAIFLIEAITSNNSIQKNRSVWARKWKWHSIWIYLSGGE